MLKMMHLLPENVPVSIGDIIPGLEQTVNFGSPRTGMCFKQNDSHNELTANKDTKPIQCIIL